MEGTGLLWIRMAHFVLSHLIHQNMLHFLLRCIHYLDTNEVLIHRFL